MPQSLRDIRVAADQRLADVAIECAGQGDESIAVSVEPCALDARPPGMLALGIGACE
jgi:hypothetical protein